MLSVILHCPANAPGFQIGHSTRFIYFIDSKYKKNLSETMRLTTQLSGIGSLNLLYFGQIMSISMSIR